MRLAGAGVKTLIVLGLTLRLHHHFHGSPIGYLGLAVASAASWIGVPGPGEPVLIAAGVLAAKHRLDIASVLVVAWAGAAAGGVGGWLIGTKAGRGLVTGPGPGRPLRLRAVARGDEVFTRVPVVAILLTPSWIAGIHRVRAGVFLPTNAAGAALWAVGIGLGAFYVGPPVVEFVNDLGWVTATGFGLLIVATIAIGLRQHRRRAREQ